MFRRWHLCRETSSPGDLCLQRARLCAERSRTSFRNTATEIELRASMTLSEYVALSGARWDSYAFLLLHGHNRILHHPPHSTTPSWSWPRCRSRPWMPSSTNSHVWIRHCCLDALPGQSSNRCRTVRWNPLQDLCYSWSSSVASAFLNS